MYPNYPNNLIKLDYPPFIFYKGELKTISYFIETIQKNYYRFLVNCYLKTTCNILSKIKQKKYKSGIIRTSNKN